MLLQTKCLKISLSCLCLQSSVLGSGFGELGGPKLGQTAGQQILEQLKGPGLGQLTSSQPPSSGDNNCAPVGGLGSTGMSVPTSSWDIKPPGTQSSASLPSQFSRKFHLRLELLFTPASMFNLQPVNKGDRDFIIILSCVPFRGV